MRISSLIASGEKCTWRLFMPTLVVIDREETTQICSKGNPLTTFECDQKVDYFAAVRMKGEALGGTAMVRHPG